jgi:hypothetical protein
MGGWVAEEEPLVHNPGTELFETALRWTPAPGDGGGRHIEDFQDLDAFVQLR